MHLEDTGLNFMTHWSVHLYSTK